MENGEATLWDLPIGKWAQVSQVDAHCALFSRLLDIGLIPGTRVTCLQKSPSGDPRAYLIRGAVIALRSEDASQILIGPAHQ